MCNNGTLQRQNTHTGVLHYMRLHIRVLTNILASVSHSTKFKHPVGSQTEHAGREDQDMKSSRKRQTCWDRDEMREIEREISLSVNTSCTGRLWITVAHFISFHAQSSCLQHCCGALQHGLHWYLYCTHTHNFSSKHTQTNMHTQFHCSFCYCYHIVFKVIVHANLNYLISYSPSCHSKLVCLNFTRET